MTSRPRRSRAPVLPAYAGMFDALSDETRLRIWLLLANGELCVCQIQVALAVSQTKISRHLSVLRNAGLVTARREGLWMYYARAAPDNPVLHTFADNLSRILEADDTLVESIVTDSRYAKLPADEVAKMAKNP